MCLRCSSVEDIWCQLDSWGGLSALLTVIYALLSPCALLLNIITNFLHCSENNSLHTTKKKSWLYFCIHIQASVYSQPATDSLFTSWLNISIKRELSYWLCITGSPLMLICSGLIPSTSPGLYSATQPGFITRFSNALISISPLKADDLMWYCVSLSGNICKRNIGAKVSFFWTEQHWSLFQLQSLFSLVCNTDGNLVKKMWHKKWII